MTEKLNENKLLKGGLTEGEIQHIKEQRKFDEVEPGTLTWNLALYNDPLRRQMRSAMNVVEQRIRHVKEFKAQIKRFQDQLDSNNIQEVDEHGNKLHPEELKIGISRLQYSARGEAEAVPLSLIDLRGAAGHKDYAGREIFSVEAFDEYAKKVLSEIKELGYETVQI